MNTVVVLAIVLEVPSLGTVLFFDPVYMGGGPATIPDSSYSCKSSSFLKAIFIVVMLRCCYPWSINGGQSSDDMSISEL